MRFDRCPAVIDTDVANDPWLTANTAVPDELAADWPREDSLVVQYAIVGQISRILTQGSKPKIPAASKYRGESIDTDFLGVGISQIPAKSSRKRHATLNSAPLV